MELRNKSVKRGNDEPRGINKLKWKNMSRPVKRGVMALGVVFGLSLAATPLIDCSSRRSKDKEPENKKGDLVSEKPKTKKVEVFMSEVEVPVETKTFSDTLKEGDSVPLEKKAGQHAEILLKVTKIDENGVGVVLEVETAFERGYVDHAPNAGSSVDSLGLLPYGKSLVLGESLYTKEIKVEKGDNPDEVLVTIVSTKPKYTNKSDKKERGHGTSW